MKLFWKNIVLCVFLLVFATIHVPAQKKAEDPNKAKTEVKKAKAAADIADKYFDTYEYYLAAQEYLKAVNEDPKYIYGLYRLAESYRLYFNYDKAQAYYKALLDIDNQSYPLARYWYALMLKNRGQYEDAIASFETFIKEYPDSDPNAEQMKEKARIDAEGCRLAINELKKPVRNYQFGLLPSPLNSGSSDYAPLIYENDTTILITSARPGTVGDKDFSMLGGKFSDFFRFQKNEDSSWIAFNPDDNFNSINTETNEGTGTFTADKKKFYFVRTDGDVKSGKYIDPYPTIYVSRNESGKWTPPVKLNENINMPGQWNSYPSISPKGDTLFFVSKRPGGKGMHDIYYAVASGEDNWGEAKNLNSVNTPNIELSPFYYGKEGTLLFSSNGREGFGGLDLFKATGPKFDTIENLGLPFNSNMDDFYFILGEEKGYLSSNREGGLGNDDVYLFNIKSAEAIIAEVNKDSLLAMAANDSTNQEGEVNSITIEGTVLYDDSKEPAADVENRLKSKDGKVLKTTKTNEDGKFRFDNLPVEDYKVEIEDKDPRLTGDVKYIVEKVKVKGSDKEVSKVLFENIYFNFDKYNLRREARKVLNELAAFYKKHPEIQIEMNANTDSYGSDLYNKKLSENRGNAALAYLIKKGVDKSALVVNALGEGKPIATNKNRAGRQLNRRVEFFILGGEGYEAKAMTYIVDPNATLAEVAKQFNMTIEELKELNGMDSDELEAYQPLRVRRTGDDDIIAPVTLVLVKPSASDSLGSRDPRFAINESSPDKFRKNSGLKRGQEYYVVAPKNTIFSIARLFGMPTAELKALNGLTSDTIYIGQRLIVKPVTSNKIKEDWKYVVKEGDTMASIAKKYGMSPQELVELNGLSGYKLYEHMVLKVK